MPTSKPIVGAAGAVAPGAAGARRGRGLARGGAAAGDVRARRSRPPPPRPSPRDSRADRRPGRRTGWAADWLAAERAATGRWAPGSRRWTSRSRALRGRCWPGLFPTGPCSGRRAPCRSATWTPGSRPPTARSRVRSNRGANGIDGVVSTALGSAAVADGPVALVVGDIAFLHDLNALVAARLHGLSATIVLVNNDGGGIFSFLPQAQPGAAAPGSGLPGALRGAVRHAARDRRRADRDGARRGAPARDRRADLRRGDPRLDRPAGRAGAGAADGPGTERRAAPGPGGGGPPGARRAGGPRERDRRRRPALGGPRPRHRRAAAAPPRVHRPRRRRGARTRRRSRARRRAIAVDLPGHGRSGTADPGAHDRGADRPTTWRRSCASRRPSRRRPRLLARGPGRAPPRGRRTRGPSDRLVLESPSAGIADPAEREARRAADEALADRHRARRHRGLRRPTGSAARSSPAMPRCARPSSRASGRSAWRNDPRGLAASLRGAGQGAMEPLHDRLASVAAPTLVIGGAARHRRPPARGAVAAGHPRGAPRAPRRRRPRPPPRVPAAFRRLVTGFLQEVPAA